MSSDEKVPAANIEHLTWAIAQRAEIQHSMLGLIQFAEANPPSGLSPQDKIVFDHLVGAAFSLWRAIFLTDAGRTPDEIHQSQTQFMAKVVADNSITYSDDKLNRHWTVGYYLENAKLRLAHSIPILDNFRGTKLTASLMPSVRLTGDATELTEYEWECAHYVLRAVFRELWPDSKLEPLRPNLPRQP